MVMGYTEPGVLYFHTGLEGLETCVASMLSRGPISSEDAAALRRDLKATLNTFRGTFGLFNTLRTVISERAKVAAPGSTPGDKKRMQWVEQQLAENDYASRDVAPEVRMLKAQYDHEASRADLRKMASAGGASSTPSRQSRGDRDRDGGGGERSKSAKRRARKERSSSRRDDESSGKAGSRATKSKPGKQHAGKSRASSDSEASEVERRPRNPPSRKERGSGSGGDKQHATSKHRSGSDKERPSRRDGAGKAPIKSAPGKGGSKGGKGSDAGGKSAKSGKGPAKGGHKQQRWADYESDSESSFRSDD